MMFEKLADAVVRHHKKILVLWVAIVILAVPAISKVNQVLAYQESEMVGGDTESLVAGRIIEEQFPVSLANSTIMVVLEGPDAYSTEARDFCLDLEGRATDDGGLYYLEGFTSIYSAHVDMVYALSAGLGPSMRATEGQVNWSASLLYGVPATYLNLWIHTDPALTIRDRDNLTYIATLAVLEDMLSASDEAPAQLTYEYYHSFTSAWNATWNDTALTADPQARAEAAISEAAPVFVAWLPYEQKAVMMSVLVSFNITSFSNTTLVHAVSISIIAGFAGIEDLAFLEQLYALGPEYETEELDDFARSLVGSTTISELPVELPPEYLSSLVSPDHSVTLVILSFSRDSNFMEDGDKPIVTNVNTLRDMVAGSRAAHLSSDYKTYVTGDAALSADMEKSMMNEMALIEPVTIILIIVLMGIFFRSVVAQFLPLGSVMVALGVSQALVLMIGYLVADIHYSVITMLFSILMGVGTDYAIFIVARYREERIKGHDREAAVRTSVTWAGESITTSGATVMISFFALALADFSMIQTMGLILGMAIGISLLVALTLVPSLIMLLGNRIFWPNRGVRWYRFAERVMERRSQGHRGYFHKAAEFSIRHAKAVVIAALLISVPTTYVYLNAETSFDFIGGMASDVESNQGIIAMSDAFGAGRIMPTEIVVVFDSPVYSEEGFDSEKLLAIDNITTALADVDNVKQVTGATNPKGDFIDHLNLSIMLPEQRATVEAMMRSMVGLDNATVLFTIILEAGPMTPESLDTVGELRSELAALKESNGATALAEVYVGGSSAVIRDLADDLDEQFRTMRIAVVIGIFIVLLIVLGALLLSLFAILSIVLSITWAFAATVGLFGYALGEPILWIIPLILFIMLMGIGMDYNIFILTRIREEIHKGKSDRDAIVESLDWTGGIITALAIIMGAAFSMMMISSTMMLKQIGFALSFAILLDAMVVRTYIVPAMMTVLGKWGWWAPGPLQRERRELK